MLLSNIQMNIISDIIIVYWDTRIKLMFRKWSHLSIRCIVLASRDKEYSLVCEAPMEMNNMPASTENYYSSPISVTAQLRLVEKSRCLSLNVCVLIFVLLD